MNQITKDLIAGKALINTPEKWTQRASARDADDREVDIDDPSACKFCSMGALTKVKAFGVSYDFLRNCLGGSIININDSYDHALVMKRWDRAIEASKHL